MLTKAEIYLKESDGGSRTGRSAKRPEGTSMEQTEVKQIIQTTPQRQLPTDSVNESRCPCFPWLHTLELNQN